MKKYVYLFLAISLIVSCEVSDDEEIFSSIEETENFKFIEEAKVVENLTVDESVNAERSLLSGIPGLSTRHFCKQEDVVFRTIKGFNYTNQRVVAYPLNLLSYDEIDRLRLLWFTHLNRDKSCEDPSFWRLGGRQAFNILIPGGNSPTYHIEYWSNMPIPYDSFPEPDYFPESDSDTTSPKPPSPPSPPSATHIAEIVIGGPVEESSDLPDLN